MAEVVIEPGSVWLVGAGPGDPDLLTRKAEKLIRAASIIFHDALVSQDVLALAPAHTRHVPVGKRSGRHSRSQEAINALLVTAALAGERIVRLKGGDPSIFARTAEEVDYLRRHGIRVGICPGITAASAAVANAGVTLTLRGKARRLQIVTAHSGSSPGSDLDWSRLADPDATLAVYMGRSAASDVGAQLMRHGLPADHPVLIAVDVSLPSERLLTTRLDLLGLATASLSDDDPVVLIIGMAVGAVEPRLQDCLRPLTALPV